VTPEVKTIALKKMIIHPLQAQQVARMVSGKTGSRALNPAAKALKPEIVQ